MLIIYLALFTLVKCQLINSTKSISIVDEVEEKEAALQMLSVFIEEVPDVCYENGDKISNLLMSLTTYEANNGIR